MIRNFSFLVFLCLFGITHAQIKEEKKSMSQGTQNALLLNLPNTNEKLAEKVWKTYSEQFGGVTKKVRDEWFTDNAVLPAIGGDNTVDLYARFSGSSADATISLWIDLGGAYVSSEEFSAKFQEAEKLMLNYSLEVARQVIQMELAEEDKELKRLETLQKKLERDNEQYHQDIENAKQKIARAESNIEGNLKEQEGTRQKIESQRKIIQTVQKKLNDL